MTIPTASSISSFADGVRRELRRHEGGRHLEGEALLA
jgi:hypothetical protein